jgi:hypothetical protein
MGPICDSDFRKDFEGALDFFRTQEVCKVVMGNYQALSDQFGAVNFEEFHIERGPEGLYSFRIIT